MARQSKIAAWVTEMSIAFDRLCCCTAPRRCRAFTLLELLVVIGIMLILISLLFPVIHSLRLSSYAASTSAQISQLRSAIENYANDWHAYPGPLSNPQIISGITFAGVVGNGANAAGNITMTENLTLGLLGGLTPTGTNGSIVYTSAALGRGPVSLLVTNPTNYHSYLADSGTSGWLSPRSFVDSGGIPANDTNIPEFVDRFPDPLPILYLRAKVGAPGIVSPDTTPGNGGLVFQYDVAQLLPYTAAKLDGKTHGLQNVGSAAVDPSITGDHPPLDALPYLRDLTRDSSNNFVKVPIAAPLVSDGNVDGVARQQNGYMLIAAGKDRTYGTFNNLTSFGSVHP